MPTAAPLSPRANYWPLLAAGISILVSIAAASFNSGRIPGGHVPSSESRGWASVSIISLVVFFIAVAYAGREKKWIGVLLGLGLCVVAAFLLTFGLRYLLQPHAADYLPGIGFGVSLCAIGLGVCALACVFSLGVKWSRPAQASPL